MTLHLLTCGLCHGTHALWPHSNYEMRGMVYSSVLGEMIHPSCLVHYIRDAEETSGIDLSPFKRLIGLDTYEREASVKSAENHLRIHRLAETGQRELNRLKAAE